VTSSAEPVGGVKTPALERPPHDYRSHTDRGSEDPHATSAAIFAVVDAEEPPLRIFLGKTPQAPAKQTHAARIAEWDAWEPVSVAAFGR
jgi:hypothetical protein